MKKLSIVIPAYNEEKYIAKLLERVLSVPTETLGFSKEVILVDDGSKDATFREASRFQDVRTFQQVPNQGKGRAVQRGIEEATGDYVLVQDADLEYDPNDYLTMLRSLDFKKKLAVYGSRTLGRYQKQKTFILPGKHPEQGLGPYGAGVALSSLTFMLYGNWLTDTLTAYKIYPMEFLRGLKVKTAGFETDHELTAKLLKQGYEIREVPIQYSPRSKEEGKKIKMSDGFTAVWTLLRFRFED